jgi:hypothetical protein
VRPLRRDQATVPGQDRVGRDDRCDRVEHRATERLALGREAPSLVVGQTESLAAKLLAQDAVLLSQVVESLGLLAIREPGEQQQEEAERGDGIGHRGRDGTRDVGVQRQ